MLTHLSFKGFLGRRLQLGVCGSIAAYKALDLVRMFRDTGTDVGATLTDSARQFVTPLSFEALGASPVFSAMYPVGDDVFGHLTPGEAAHAMLIAPATASTLARLANGLADDMLSCQALAFPKPLVIAPAMNPRMWHNAATQANWETLKARGHVCIEPGCGRTACMEEGRGRLADLNEIFLYGLRALTPQDMAGQTVMITLGPTREKWDGVRFWSNPSSGTMGACFAVAAWLRGATVHAVTGPGTPWLPSMISRYDVTSAREMFEAAEGLWPTMDIGVFTAAVADFSPIPFGDEKFKKGAEELVVRFASTTDILKTLGAAKKEGQRIVGFAAETSSMQENALKKLRAKNADMVVGNIVGRADSGFQSPTNEVFVTDRNGRQEEWPVQPKTEVAWRVLDWLLQL
ncbi:bifunctional phosphopantothenoylcysteine decarboxylase/phosphopantothenate--cysteine ligase CoaBC [Desulfovibrio subterraneus]|uniref:bifunctional phosphopantothenoylcysteine decarboxylase/phosphopantothenate--cysteine ligase CoaBC n=1 Tax=Desulfovibrio subterraneus TaxID=2718620 RepID=UPI0022B8E0CF|nr:bifunctional phosphopantothenoylcysteine decarboxylase/phosphopantothenate--cysteine ligase CoaBC [Desulfovibrio subterraneus]WBF66573.1 bifunctional phosphopantothenoylcysteine decarboxylase/phosphopantothenate--cysteine ligase CoaBC [Desulfovibrio subterraneus]